MPGIVGFVQHALHSEAALATLKSMVSVLRPLPGFVDETLFYGPAAIASVGKRGSNPISITVADDIAALAFWGYLWNWDEVTQRSGESESSPAEALLRLFRRCGAEGFCGLNGRYVCAIWHKLDQTLYLVNDRHGFCPLYYWASEKAIYFASLQKAIVRQEGFPGKVDLLGLSEMMTFGHNTDDRTFFEHLKVLPRASLGRFRVGDGLKIVQYWDYSFYSKGEGIRSEDDYVEEFHDRLTRAVARQVPPGQSLSLPLSGGLDSRTMAGMICREIDPGRVNAYSFGHADCFDVVYGRHIAKKLGIEHNYVTIDPAYLKDWAEKFVWVLDGTVDCLNAHMSMFIRTLNNANTQAVLSGFFGDIVCGTDAFYIIGLNECESSISKIQYPKYANIMNENDLKIYFQKKYYKKISNINFENFKSKYSKCNSNERYYKSRYFALCDRQRRYTSFNIFIYDHFISVLSPFLDHDFLDFALHLPPNLAIHSNVYIKMINRHLPKAASAPYNETRLPLNAPEWRKGLHWRWQKLLRNPIARATIGRKYLRRDDNYLNTAAAIRTGSREFVLCNIRNNPFLAEYFNMDQVHRMLDAHMDGQRKETGKITALLTLSLWHQLFVEGKGFTGEYQAI